MKSMKDVKIEQTILLIQQYNTKDNSRPRYSKDNGESEIYALICMLKNQLEWYMEDKYISLYKQEWDMDRTYLRLLYAKYIGKLWIIRLYRSRIKKSVRYIITGSFNR